MKVLHLTLKKQWFDMIASGEKKEEYRELKQYWISRLAWTFISRHDEGGLFFDFEPLEYGSVTAKNGYAKDAPTIQWEHKGIRIGEGKPEWGAEPDKQYFILEIGELVK